MRVMCMNHDDFGYDCHSWTDSDPQIGSEYEAIRSVIGYDNKGKRVPSYELKGFLEYVYDQRNFATLPDATADEMQEVVHEAIVNLETA